MRINIISIKERQDRRDLLIPHLKEHGITDYKFWDGIVDPFMVFRGICQSHKSIVRWAKENNLDKVIIAEDDFFFTAPGAFNYYLANEPGEYDIYLSGIYWGNIKEDNTVDEFAGLTLYMIHSRFYDTFLAHPENNHIDMSLKLKGKYVVCNPFITKQRNGYSDNAKTVINYDHYLEGRTFFTCQTH